MIRIVKRNQIGKLLAWLFILTLPLAGTKNSLYPPVLLKLIDGLHNVSLAFEHGEIHLVLSHPEENNNRGITADHEGSGHHSGHEFHTDLCCLQIAEAIRTVEIPRNLSPAVISCMASAPDKFSPASFISKPRPEVNATLISRLTTVLLI